MFVFICEYVCVFVSVYVCSYEFCILVCVPCMFCKRVCVSLFIFKCLHVCVYECSVTSMIICQNRMKKAECKNIVDVRHSQR